MPWRRDIGCLSRLICIKKLDDARRSSVRGEQSGDMPETSVSPDGMCPRGKPGHLRCDSRGMLDLA